MPLHWCCPHDSTGFMGFRGKDNGNRVLLLSHQIKCTSYQYDLKLLMLTLLPASWSCWSYCTFWKEVTIHSPHLRNGGLIPHLCENGVSTKINWYYSAWENCLFSSFIYPVINLYHLFINLWAYLFFTFYYNPIILYLFLRLF